MEARLGRRCHFVGRRRRPMGTMVCSLCWPLGHLHEVAYFEVNGQRAEAKLNAGHLFHVLRLRVATPNATQDDSSH